jgi:hypothetical protein
VEDQPDQRLAEQAAEIATISSEEAQRTPRHQRLRGLVRRQQNDRRQEPAADRTMATRGMTAVRRTRATVNAAARGTKWTAGWLSEQVLAMAPRIKVRDRQTLQQQFPGQSIEDIADALVDGAARASAAAGGAAGMVAVLPVLPAFPAEIVAETLVVVGVEIKLIAELHEIYGVPAQGAKTQKMMSYVASWTNRRGITVIPGGVAFAAGSPLSKLLRRRLVTRAGRSAASLGPLLTGAAAGAYLNGRETRRLGQQIRRDLRSRTSHDVLQQ